MPTPDISGAEVRAYLELGQIIGKLFSGLFKNKQYPFARVDIAGSAGRAFVFDVVSLDGTDITAFRALGNRIAADMLAQMNRVPAAERGQVLGGNLSIGYSSSRPGFDFQPGWFAELHPADGGPVQRRDGLPSQQAAIAAGLKLWGDDLRGWPSELIKFDGTRTPTSSVRVNTAAVNDALNTTDIAIQGVIAADNDIIKRALDANTRSIETILESTDIRFGNAMTSFVSTQEGFLDDTTDLFNVGLDLLLGRAQTTQDKSLSRLLGLIESALSDQRLLSGSLFERISRGFELALDTQSILEGNLFNILAFHNQIFIDKAIGVLGTIEDLHRKSISNVVERGNVAFRTFDVDLRDKVEGTIDRSKDAAPPEAEPADVRRGFDVVALEKAASEQFGRLEAVIGSGLSALAPEWVKSVGESLALDPDNANALERWMFETANIFELGQETCEDRFSKAATPEDFSYNFIRFVANVVSALAFPILIAQARATACLQMWNEGNPSLEMPPPEAILSVFRGLLSHDEGISKIQRQGFSNENAERILTVARPLPEENTLLTMWLREFLTDAETDKAFEGKGWTAEWTQHYKDIAFFIPPVQDLITMAVREVFDPVIAAEFGQFEDFPEEFGKWAKQQGVSDEWAKNYWAAHWALPSIQMGFEMLHRRVIDETKLKQLMVALDIMPGWRDELIQISYTPFTRIDIRRMNRVGVLSSEDVYEAYLDIGYSPAKARQLQDFVQRLNEPQETLAEQLADELTRSNILGFYDDGIIARSTAAALLKNAGYNAITTELFLDSEDFDRERKERKADIRIIGEQVKNGALTFNEAAAQLDSLGLETRERDLALLSIQRIVDANVKMPSKSDLDKFVKKGLIDKGTYESNMERLGFTEFWTAKYLTLAME